MRKRPGRPPLARDPKPGIYRILSDNIEALLEVQMRLRDDQSMTDTVKEIVEGKKMSANTIIRAYGGRNDTGIETLDKIAKMFKVRAADLLTEGACRRIMIERTRASSPQDADGILNDDDRLLHRR